jgi:rhodanese-related sulfurtransferase
MQQISAAQLQAWLDDPSRTKPAMIDVREPWELDICRIPEAKSVPMRSIQARIAELDPSVQTVVICHHGARSFQVAMYLEQQGFEQLFNLHGGMAAWAQVVPGTPTY